MTDLGGSPQLLHLFINNFNKEAFLSCRAKWSYIIQLCSTISFLILDPPLPCFLIMEHYDQIQIDLPVKQENDYISSGDDLPPCIQTPCSLFIRTTSLFSDMFSV